MHNQTWTYSGTAGATLDFSEAPGLDAVESSLSRTVFSFETILLEVISPFRVV